jgi:hypothetical protein
MAIMVDEVVMDVGEAKESKARGAGGDSGSKSAGDAPKPEEIEHALRQQCERMERVRAH